jgi:hypothetical protein
MTCGAGSRVEPNRKPCSRCHGLSRSPPTFNPAEILPLPQDDHGHGEPSYRSAGSNRARTLQFTYSVTKQQPVTCASLSHRPRRRHHRPAGRGCPSRSPVRCGDLRDHFPRRWPRSLGLAQLVEERLVNRPGIDGGSPSQDGSGTFSYDHMHVSTGQLTVGFRGQIGRLRMTFHASAAPARLYATGPAISPPTGLRPSAQAAHVGFGGVGVR